MSPAERSYHYARKCSADVSSEQETVVTRCFLPYRRPAGSCGLAIFLFLVSPALFAQEGHRHQREFSEGLAAVGFDRPDTIHGCDDCTLKLDWGFVDSAGKLVIPAQFAAVRDFSNGLAAVQNKQGKWAFINQCGENVSGFRFDYAYSFAENLAVVRIGNRYGYVNPHGKFAIPLQFTDAHKFSSGLAVVRFGGKTQPEFSLDIGVDLTTPVGVDSDDVDELGGHRAFIDKTGLIQFRVPQGVLPDESFSGGSISFTVTKPDGYNYCGYLNTTGKVIIQPQFGLCDPFNQGRARVLLNGTWHTIDKSGAFLAN